MVPHVPPPPASPPIIIPPSPPPIIMPASPPPIIIPPSLLGWQYPVMHAYPGAHVLPAQHG